MKKKHNLLHNIIEGAKDAIYVKDLKGYYTMINPAGALLIGKSVKDIIGKNDMDLFSPDTAHRIMERDQSVITSGRTDEFEETLISSGITRSYITTRFPNRNHLGNTIGVIGIAHDITEFKLTKDNLWQRTELVKLQHEITLTANEAPNVEEAMKFCLTRICNYTDWPIGHVYIPDSSGKLLPTDIWHTRDKKKFKKFREITQKTTFTIGEGLPGRVLRDARPHWIVDVTKDPGFIRTKLIQKINVKGAFAFPVLERESVVAVLEFFSRDIAEPDTLILDTITQLATQLGRVTERKKTEMMLQEQKMALEQKNIALSELLGQLEIEKQFIKDNVTANAENLLLPVIQKLGLTGKSRKYVQLLRKNIQELTSSFGTKLIKEEAKLTSREIEICNMIKNGLTSKEIAGLLNITLGTVGRHRNNIRKKLGIISKECNLSSFLKMF